MSFLGLDVGTQSLKAVVLDDGLALRGGGTAGYALAHPRAGWAEQDPRVWLAALGPAIAAALAAANCAPGDVRALGVAGQLDGCVAVDHAGTPTGRCLIWMDRRADAEIPAAARPLVARLGAIVADPGHMAAKIAWLKRHAGAAGRFHQPTSFVVRALTGRDVLDHGLASTTMLYGVERRGWEPALLDAFGVRADELPAIAECTDVAGTLSRAGATLTGLPAGIPVAVGTGDDFSNLVGAGVTAPGILACSLGTAEVVGALASHSVRDPEGLVETHRVFGGLHFVENPGWSAGGTISWLGAILGGASAAEIDRLAATAPPGADRVSFLPALAGAMAPRWEPRARAAFYGLAPAHGAGHLSRAVLEGCAFAMADVLDRLQALGLGVTRIRLAGGGAKSALWARIRADVAGLPVECVTRADPSALGAAAMAAVAACAFPDLAAAAARFPAPDSIVTPDAATAPVYAEARAAGRRLFDALTPLFS